VKTMFRNHPTRDRLAIWCNRAQMAEQRGDGVLTEKALDRCWECQNTIAASIQEIEPPPRPRTAHEVLEWISNCGGSSSESGPGRPRDPYQPSGVPRRPMPVSGAGEIALPLPPTNDTDDDGNLIP